MRYLLLTLLLFALFALAASGTARAGVKRMRCFLQIDGSALLDGWCPVAVIHGGSLTINVPELSRRSAVFAEVDVAPDGTARAYWNETRGNPNASSPLGPVRKQHGCWTNHRARICVTR